MKEHHDQALAPLSLPSDAATTKQDVSERSDADLARRHGSPAVVRRGTSQAARIASTPVTAEATNAVV